MIHTKHFPIASSANWHGIAATLIVVLCSAFLLFTKLDYYAIGADESLTVMTARSVWRTGDTDLRVDDHNIPFYSNGLMLSGFKDRYSPPLQFYFLAPFVGILGDSTLVCRLPFAIVGLLGIALILHWLWRIKPPAIVWWVAAIAILTNVEYFLFARFCRYYALVMFLTLLAAYFYIFRRDGRVAIIGLSCALALLLPTHILDYTVALICLGADYIIWGRKEHPYKPKDWLVILLPQVIVGLIVLSIWNPLTHGDQPFHSPFIEGACNLFDIKLQALELTWISFALAGFGIVGIMFLCYYTYFIRKSLWPIRVTIATLIFGCAVALLDRPGSIDLRYMTPMTMLGMALTIVFAYELYLARKGVIAFGLIVLLWGFQYTLTVDGLIDCPGILLFLEELHSPPSERSTCFNSP